MSESVGRDAQTIHRLLKWNPVTNRFTFDAENPMQGDVFVFDETSMIDVKLAASLMSAVPSGAAVVWVGDTDQLPSVGAGSVLGDLIKSGIVASTRLDKIFRQDSSGLIVVNAHHVNAGEPLEIRKDGDSDFYFARIEDPAECVRRAIDFMKTRIPRKFGMDPLEDEPSVYTGLNSGQDSDTPIVAPPEAREDGPAGGELAERQRKFGMMMKPFQI
jgi:exodeoxyribonuclease V alpha subunit